MGYFELIIGCIFVNNILLAQFLGNCPFLGTSKKMETALGMAGAVVFVTVLAGTITWLIYHLVLVKFDLVYLRTFSFILVIAALVQFVEMVIQKLSPALYQSLGIYLPLITTNCAILGVAILNIDNNFNFIQSLVYGFSAGVGFTMALVLMAGLRERLEMAPIPKALRGIPIAFLMAGCMAIAFLGFSGLKLS